VSLHWFACCSPTIPSFHQEGQRALAAGIQALREFTQRTGSPQRLPFFWMNKLSSPLSLSFWQMAVNFDHFLGVTHLS
jgi:hypothetical protein